MRRDPIYLTFEPIEGLRLEGMSELQISETAGATGFSVSALRFGIGPDGVCLNVTEPEEARDVIASFFGKAA